MTQVIANITTKWGTKTSYSPVATSRVQAYSIDTAMDTDTDSWTLQIGDPDLKLLDVLKRDNEVHLNIVGLADGAVEALNTGFADEIVMDEQGTLTFNGRDFTAVAVDSQHPPQVWHGLRPEVLVRREAEQLKIAQRLNLNSGKAFKTGTTDGSESYWQVWYRFYRKRRMWLWGEPDGALSADVLHYNQPVSYYFGTPTGIQGDTGKGGPWLPVEVMEWRSSKQQRVGEVFYFGHHGVKANKLGFVARAIDPSTKTWIKRPNRIITSGNVHSQAEARIEAWEEIFESKVGSVEIKLTIADPGLVIRQNTMAYVNLPKCGLKGEFFVVGTTIVGSVDEGFYQVVRLREKNYAISRRVPTDPHMNEGFSDKTSSDIAKNIPSGIPWRQYFVEAAQKYRGPWPFQLFLAVLLSICEHETGFNNYRNGGHTAWPGNSTGKPPTNLANPVGFAEFRLAFSNEKKYGVVSEDKAVGPMQLLTPGYKYAADRLAGSRYVGGSDGVINELYGGRWHPRWNIMAGAAALASKLGAGVHITSDGEIQSAPVTGLSLKPTEENIWTGVGYYFGSTDETAVANYIKAVKDNYTIQYKTEVAAAVTASRQDAKQIQLSKKDEIAMRGQILNNQLITFTNGSESDDIRYGLIYPQVLRCLLWLTQQGFPLVITALKSDHKAFTAEGRKSAHSYGLAVDIGNYNASNPVTEELMNRLGAYQEQLGFDQLIGPVESKCINGLVHGSAGYDRTTLNDHKTHVHIGWPISLATGKK